MQRFSFLPGCRVLQIERGSRGSRVILADNRRGSARCPPCGAVSRAVHSRYRRSPADLPDFGHELRVALLVRRFYCRQATCPKRTFAERFAGAVAPHARRARRLEGTGPGRDRSRWRCGRAVRPRDLDASQQGHPATRHPGIALAVRYAAAELKAWLTEASSCDITAVQTFVAGLEQDGAAVRAALTLPWSSGQAEGRIDRLKPLKRQMYGRASLDLLRRRTLLAA
nr:transposase family protein [Azospirillum brasilense]